MAVVARSGAPRLVTLVALGLALVAGSCARHRPGGARPVDAAPAPPADLALLYTADVHGQSGSLARRATLVDRARLDARAIVQVDAGDFLPAADDPAFAAPTAFARRARLVLGAYQRMDVDVVTLGPRELAVDATTLRQWVRETKLPVVLANVVGEDGKPLFDPTRSFSAGEHKIGVLGVVELGPGDQALLQRQKLTVDDPAKAAAAAARALRAGGAELVIALVNAPGGAARARAIAGGAPIDVVVLARVAADNAAGPPPLVVSVAPGGTQVGRIDVRGSAPGWRLSPRTLAVDATVAEQLGTALLLRADTTTILGLPPPPGQKPPPRKENAPVVYESWTYASTQACAFCHKAQIAQWKTTDHAHAMATLKKKGHDHDPACVGCHSVAFLQPGGTVNLETLALNFTDVGCESCHGPSAAHVRAPDINKKVGTVRNVDPLVCLGCHTPDQSQGPFEFATALKEVIGPGHSPTQPGGAGQ